VIVAGAKAEMTIGVGPGLCGTSENTSSGRLVHRASVVRRGTILLAVEGIVPPANGRGKEGHIMQSSKQDPVHVAPGEGAMRRVVGDLVSFKMVGEHTSGRSPSPRR
jgi:hypothetical protein